ncbi:MAG: O-antigen ligase family protein [Patescibacteria group bacterium]|nr:O-antigen ligase family protein [Patescibacteria group bacterium]
MKTKIAANILFALTALALLSPLWVFRDLLFPYITSKAFTFRALVELGLPFYVYLLLIRPSWRPSWRNPVLLLAAAFLLLSFVSSFAGVNMTRSLWGNFERMGGSYYLLHLVLLSLYVVLLGQIGGAYIKNMLYFALAVSLLVTLNGVGGWLGLPTLTPDPSLPTRVSSTFGNPIFLGSFLILPMFLSAFFALQAESLGKKILFWALVALQFAGIILSATRGAVVGLAVGLILAAIVYVISSRRSAVRLYGTVATVGLLLLFVGLFVFHQKLPQGGALGRVFNLEDSNAQARLIQWRVALRGFKDDPVLGVGPENYYIIANKYYNSDLIKYDPSWFDKPHNYLLEVLVTTGVLGFLAYMGLIAAVCWALYQAWRRGLISRLQLALLLAGFVSYFVQNLFVFDTIPASLMFYVFVGFAGFLWSELSAGQNGRAKQKLVSGPPALALTASGLTLIVAVYAVYVTNIVPAQAARDVNYGYAYASVDPKVGVAYFKAALDSPFNFDPQDTAQRFSDFSAQTAQKYYSQDLNFALDTAQRALDFEQQTARGIGNDPVSWQKLASDYYILAFLQKQPLPPQAEQAARRAIELAPGRFEPQMSLVQVFLQEGRTDQAVAQLQRVTASLPLTNYTASAWWTLADLLRQSNHADQALAILQQPLQEKFLPSSARDLYWLLQYYEQQKDYQNFLSLAQAGAKTFTNDADIYFAVVRGLAETGQVDQAKSVAQSLITADPPNKQAVQDFLKTLK